MKNYNYSSTLTTILYRWILLTSCVVLCLFTIDVKAQSAVNYTFGTASNGSLTDMSTGTATLNAANSDDNASAVSTIGFDFYYMGVRYGQFSTNSNGLIRLGSTAVQNGSPYKPLAQAGIPLITAYGADLRTHTSGKVHFKVTGSSPNRVMIIEWLNMQSNFSSGGTVDLTYQARLYETTGIIEFVYGSMTMSTAGAADVNSQNPNIGFSTSNVANSVGTVTAPQSGTPAPSYSGTPTSAVANLYTAGTITVLTSVSDGSRRVFTFTPSVTPADPTGLNFTAINASGMTLNWTDVSGELAYAIYRSDDGGTTYSFVSLPAANATSAVMTGLTPGITYFWRVYAVTEGRLSANPTSNSQATLSAATYFFTGASLSDWNTGTNWNTAANGSGSARTTPLTTDILIVDGAGIIAGGSLSISISASQTIGALQITSGTTLTLLSSTTTTRTITLSGSLGDELSIPATNSLLLNNATNAVAINFLTGTGMTGDISGTLTFAGSISNTLTTTGGTGTIVTVSSTGIVNLGQIVTGITLVGSAATLVFANGSNCNLSGATTFAPPVPLATWGASANLTITGITTSTTAPTNNAQSFGNVTYNCTLATLSMSFFTSTTTAVIKGNLTILATNTGRFRINTSGTLNISGNLNVSGGTCEIASTTGTTIVAGNVNLTGGTLDITSGTGAATLRVAGTFNQTAGTLTVSGTSTTNNLEFNGTVAQNATFATVTGPVGVRLNNVNGLTLNGTLNINNTAAFTVSNGTVSGPGSIVYNATSSRLVYNSTNNAQTATAFEFPAAGGPTSLTINNTNTAPNNTVTVPFSRTLGTAGVLTLTAGILDNSGGNLLTITNTATGGISGGSATAFVKGAVARTLPASLASGTTYVFPVGKGTYRPFELVNPRTNAGGTVVARAEVFDANSGGTLAGSLSAINTNRYWAASITSGGANFDSTLIRLNDTTGIAGGTADCVAGSISQSGVYSLIGGNSTTVTATSIASTNSSLTTTLLGFYVMGLRATPTFSGLAITPTGNQCSTSARTVTVTVTPGGAAVDSVVIIYSVAGGVTNARVSMSQAPATFWTGVIPAPIPATGLVTWSVTAYDAAAFVKTQAGPSFKDGSPNPGQEITITPATPSFCGNGGTTSLTAFSTNSNYAYTFTALDFGSLSNITANTADATVSQTSAFRVVGVNGLCVDSGFVSIGVYSFPVASPSPATAKLCLGDSITLNSGLSATGFSFGSITHTPKTAPANANVLASGGAAVVTLTGGTLDDGGWGSIPIGFSFNYFGNSFSTINIGTNGVLQFGAFNNNSGFTTPYGLSDYSFTTLPSTGEPFNMIAVCANDNHLTNLTVGGGTLRYWTTGYAPNRIFVVEYLSVRQWNSTTNTSTAQAHLFESTGIVEVHVTGSTSTNNKLVGLQNANGTIGTIALATTSPISSPVAYRFIPPTNYTMQWTSTPASQFGSGATSGTNVFSVKAKPTGLGIVDYKIFFSDQVTGCNNLNNEPHVFITAVTPPVAPVINEDTIRICGTATVLLFIADSTGSASFPQLASTDTAYWYTNLAGSQVAKGNTYRPTVSATTKYYVKSYNGTCFIGLDSVVVKVRTPLTILTATNDGPKCLGSSFQISASSTEPGYSFLWTPGSLVGTPQNVTPLAVTTYLVTATNNTQGTADSGCVVMASTTIAFIPQTNFIAVTADQNNLCVGGSTGLHAVVSAPGVGIVSGAPIVAPIFSPATDEDNGVSGTAGYICPGNNLIGSFTLPPLASGTYKGGRLTLTGISNFPGSLSSEIRIRLSGAGILGGDSCLSGTTSGSSPNVIWITKNADSSIIAARLNPAGGNIDITYSDSYNDDTTGADANFTAGSFRFSYLDPALLPTYSYSWSVTSGAATLTPNNAANITASSVGSGTNVISVTATPSDASCPVTGTVTLVTTPLALSVAAAADPANYTFTNTTSPYALLSGATAVAATNADLDDGITAAIPIGFTFNGSFTSLKMNTNGWMTFNTASVLTGGYTSLSSTQTYLVAAFNRDLDNTSMSYLLDISGGPGNGIFKAQWNGFFSWSSSVVPDAGSCQVWLYEATGVIEIRYGTFTEGARTTSGTVMAGIKGSSTAAAQIKAATGATWPGAIASSSSTSTLAIAVGNLPDAGRLFRFTPPAASPTICEGDSVLLLSTVTGGGTPYVYSWSSVPPGFSSSAASVYVKPSVNTTYSLKVKSSCLDSLTQSVTVNVTNNPIAITPVDTTLCGFPHTATLTASGASNYSWTGLNLLTTTGASVSASPTDTTLYTVTGTVGSCTYTKSTHINVRPAPDFTILRSDSVLCGTGTLASIIQIVDGDPNYSYTWTESINGVLDMLTGDYLNASTTLTVGLTVTATENVNNCILTKSTSLSVFEFQAYNAVTNKDSICASDSAYIGTGVSAQNFSSVCISSAYKTEPGFAVSLCDTGVSSPLPPGVTHPATSLDDGYWSNVPIGFNFNYFGSTKTTVSIGTNGVVMLGTPSTQYTFPGGFPSVSNPASTIALCATDLYFTAGGSIKYWTEGFAPARVFVVSYKNADPFLPASYGPGKFTGQLFLYETTGIVEMHIQRADQSAQPTTGGGVWAASRLKVIGLQDSSRTIGATAPLCSAPFTENYWNSVQDSIVSPMAWRFSPPVSYSFLWSSSPAGFSSTSSNPYVHPSGSVKYYVTIHDNFTLCNVTDSVTVFGRAPIGTPVTQGDSICGPGTITLTATGADSLFWYTVASGGTKITSGVSANGQTYAPSLSTTTTFYVESNNGFCGSTRASVRGKVNPVPTVTSATADSTSGCAPFSTLLHATSSISGSTFSWSPATYLTNPTSANPLASGVPSGPHLISVNAISPLGCISNAAGSVVLNPFNCSATVNVKALIQGYYIGGGQMTPVLYKQLEEFGPALPGTYSQAIVDTVIIELRDGTDPYTLVDQYKAVIDTGGKVTGQMSVATIGTSYYIGFRHRSALLTFSANPVLLQAVTSYDFRLRADSAAGVPYPVGFPYEQQYNFGDGFFGIYNGDVDQDEYIATSDVTLVDNDNLSGLFSPGGYWITDIDGDGYVSTGDVTPVDNSNLAGVFTQYP